MNIYDLVNLEAETYENRNVNVLFQNEQLKTRIILLEEGGRIPECKMDSFVLFYVVKGEVLLRKGSEISPLREGQLFISEPAILSMESAKGARLLGVQVKN